MKAYTGKGMFRRWWHLLFACPTFWRSGLSYTCPVCDKHFRCYWDGQRVEGYERHCCNRCAKKILDFRKADAEWGVTFFSIAEEGND
jgi:hypothetical protein